METVKEFLDAGLVFVKGDVCVDGYRGRYCEDWFLAVIDGVNLFDDFAVTELAWRTNTGEKPSFIGVVELEYAGAEKTYKRHSDKMVWDNDILIKWRPVMAKKGKMEDELAAIELAERVELASDAESLIDLDDNLEVKDALEKLQQDAKPTYTKEMHEAGELPPIGSKFTLAEMTCCQRINKFQGLECTVIGHCKDLDGDDVITFSEPSQGCACMLHIHDFIKPIDTRTDEEKLIDEACDLVRKIDGEPLDCSEVAIIECMVSILGYRKP